MNYQKILQVSFENKKINKILHWARACVCMYIYTRICIHTCASHRWINEWIKHIYHHQHVDYSTIKKKKNKKKLKTNFRERERARYLSLVYMCMNTCILLLLLSSKIVLSPISRSLTLLCCRIIERVTLESSNPTHRKSINRAVTLVEFI